MNSCKHQIGQKGVCGLNIHRQFKYGRRRCSRPNIQKIKSLSKDVIILGIESSCDDSAAAVVSGDGQILSEAIVPQTELTNTYGGVYPYEAWQAHKRVMASVIDDALSQAGVKASGLTAVATTYGPGLEQCLTVGVRQARQLSYAHHLPIVPIHHLEAHALTVRLTTSSCHQRTTPCTPSGVQSSGVSVTTATGGAHGDSGHSGSSTDAGRDGDTQRVRGAETSGKQIEEQERITFPYLCLLVSGGHNQLLLVEGVGQYIRLGTTGDDAIGEAFDKTARSLGVPLLPSGGAAIESYAQSGDPNRYEFTVPLINRPDCDFSFSGLKTQVKNVADAELARVDGDIAGVEQIRSDVSASFQLAAATHLRHRCRRAVAWARELYPELDTLVMSGGVASNKYIRGVLKDQMDKLGMKLCCPPVQLCTDNGVMVAWAGCERYALGQFDPPITQQTDSDEFVQVYARWPLTSRRHEKSTTVKDGRRVSNLYQSLSEASSNGLSLSSLEISS